VSKALGERFSVRMNVKLSVDPDHPRGVNAGINFADVSRGFRA
jgi:hypothetical protein